MPLEPLVDVSPMMTKPITPSSEPAIAFSRSASFARRSATFGSWGAAFWARAGTASVATRASAAILRVTS
jgi:hypothetical protein